MLDMRPKEITIPQEEPTIYDLEMKHPEEEEGELL